MLLEGLIKSTVWKKHNYFSCFFVVPDNSHFHVSSSRLLNLSSAVLVLLSSAFKSVSFFVYDTSCGASDWVIVEGVVWDSTGSMYSGCVVAKGTRDVGEACGDSDSSLIGSISGLLSWHTDSCRWRLIKSIYQTQFLA